MFVISDDARRCVICCSFLAVARLTKILSSNLIAIAYPEMTHGAKSQPFGTIGILSLDHFNHGCPRLPHLAYLQLRVAESVPLLDEPAGRTYYPYSSKLTFQQDPAYRPTTGTFLSHAPASIFELSNVRRVLQLEMTLEMHCKLPSGSDLVNTQISYLYILVDTILRAVSRMQANTANDCTVPWSEWGAEARWVLDCNLGEHDPSSSTTGSRSIRVHFGPCHLDCHQNKLTDGRSCETFIYEFHPALQRTNGQPGSGKQVKTPSGRSTWTSQPPGPNSLTPGRHWFDKWLGDASISVISYKAAHFKHKGLAKMFKSGWPSILIDDEHSEPRMLTGIPWLMKWYLC